MNGAYYVHTGKDRGRRGKSSEGNYLNNTRDITIIIP
jgi:hypothetical protein